MAMPMVAGATAQLAPPIKDAKRVTNRSIDRIFCFLLLFLDDRSVSTPRSLRIASVYIVFYYKIRNYYSSITIISLSA